MANILELLVNDVVAILGLFGGPQWGIFLDGDAVIVADNQINFELKQDFPISEYPTEDGGFQSYDKVQLPTEIRCSFSAGGSASNRQAFLDSIDAVMNTIDLYDIVTPEAVYQSYNFIHRDFRRTALNGVGLITVDLWLKEVRVTSTATFQNTLLPSEAGSQSIGTVQATTPTPDFNATFGAVS